MKKILSLFLLGLILGSSNSACLAATWSSDDEALLKSSNQAYSEGKFSEASKGYESLSEKYPHDGALYYNLGNAKYREGRLGDAILAYERAFLYLPRNRDVRENLKFARSELEYKVEDKRNWYLKALEVSLQFFTKEEITVLLLFSVFLLLTSWCFVVWTRGGAAWGIVRKSLLVFAALSLLLFGAKSIQMQAVRGAIVKGDEVEVRYGPSDTDQVAFRLGEGLKVYVTDERKNWSRILLTNGESGWAPSRKIIQI